jgi:type II secretory pathway component PulM
MKNKSLQATSVRSALTFLLIAVVVVSTAGFYFAQDWLNNMANDISSNSTSADPSDSSAQALATIKTEIAKNKSAADKASSLISTSASYKDQMTKDINKYASQAGLSIKSINTNQPSRASDMGNNIKVGFASVTFNNPVSLQSLLQFLKGVESNTPKMQVSGIDITAQDSSKAVDVKPLTIEGYFK